MGVIYMGQSFKSDGTTSYQHKPFDLDFLPQELLRSPSEHAQLSALRAMPLEKHLEKLRAQRQRRISSTYRALLVALESALASNRMKAVEEQKVVAVTLFWGSRLAKYLPGALRRAEALGLGASYLVFCLDDAGLEACLNAHSHPSSCVPGHVITIFNNLCMQAAIIANGFDVLYLDFDTLLLQNPIPALMEAASEAEILVSRDFGSECLNTGVIYFKAHKDTAYFLETLMVWLWHHPYEFSQKAFSAFLEVESVSNLKRATKVELYDIKKMPRWKPLDSLNKFVTSIVYNPAVEGWTGNMEDIVIYHFLDGNGGANAATAVAGKYVNLFEAFYSNSNLDLADLSRPLWEQDEDVKHILLQSRNPGPPAEIMGCYLLPDGDDPVVPDEGD